MDNKKIVVSKIELEKAIYYEIKIVNSLQQFKVTIENYSNPFKQNFIFIPNDLKANLREEIILAIKKYDADYGETLSD